MTTQVLQAIQRKIEISTILFRQTLGFFKTFLD